MREDNIRMWPWEQAEVKQSQRQVIAGKEVKDMRANVVAYDVASGKVVILDFY